MKNRLPFAALTFAFTIAGACVGASLHGFPEGLSALTAIVALVGGAAAAWSADILP